MFDFFSFVMFHFVLDNIREIVDGYVVDNFHRSFVF